MVLVPQDCDGAENFPSPSALVGSATSGQRINHVCSDAGINEPTALPVVSKYGTYIIQLYAICNT